LSTSMVRRPRVGAVAVLAAVLVAGCAGGAPGGVGMRQVQTATPAVSATATASRSTNPPAMPVTPEWHLAGTPTLEGPTSVLWDVVGIDATHAYAVGGESYNPDQPDSSGRPVIEQWDGHGWTRMPLPAVTWRGSLAHVVATGPADVWAVGGSTGPDPQNTLTRVLHYDGTAWREVAFPPGNRESIMQITGVAAVGGHLWLVGNKSADVVLQEWDGHVWRARKPPPQCLGNLPIYCTVTAVSAFGVSDVWAAGNGSYAGFTGPLLFHWDGEAWAVVQVGINDKKYAFTAVGGSSPTDLWAVGGGPGILGQLAVHGDGRTWQRAPDPLAADIPRLATDTAGRAWVIANTTQPGATVVTYTGTTSAATPMRSQTGTVGLSLRGITAVPGTGLIIAVGDLDLPTTPRYLRAAIFEYSAPS
jgi:hypothetical protein